LYFKGNCRGKEVVVKIFSNENVVNDDLEELKKEAKIMR
jgi:hypothetical protein